MNPYYLIIGASLIIIISYFFNMISRKTSIPSVLLLIIFGILIKQGMKLTTIPEINFFPILEILGIVGLIMIVLEASLDLELKKEKWGIIWRSFSIALLSLVATSFIISYVIITFYDCSTFQSLLYAIPLSIISSAIVIPSVTELNEDKKEFLIYEGTFSDILGIMFFYFLLGSTEASSSSEVIISASASTIFTIIISIAISIGLLFVFQQIKTNTKLFLLISVLLVLYSIGKMFHLSSLIIILIFGLVLNNRNLLQKSFLKKHLKEDNLLNISNNFKIITIETAFVIRTFFFVIFGVTISLYSLLNVKVVFASILILGIIYAFRFIIFKVFRIKSAFPEILISPRGLITILLFFSIPSSYKIIDFNSGILLFTILLTSIIMAWALIKNKKNKSSEEESFSSDDDEKKMEAPETDTSNIIEWDERD